jgi:hypothetical protein
MPSRFFSLVLFALALAACQRDPSTTDSSSLPTSPVFITNGEIDESGTYANVGALIVQDPEDDQIFPICTGTLISPTEFLTASHCTAFYVQDLTPDGFTAFVSFDSPIGWGDETDLGSTDLLAVDQAVTNPGATWRQSDPQDLGVLILEDPVAITPATLPTLGLLDQLNAQKALRGATFTSVGYGVQDRVVGGGPPFFLDANPIPRMFAFGSFFALSPGYLRLSMNSTLGDGGTCYGDSGGPNFLTVNGQQILVATTVTGDIPCRATNVVQRLDIASVRAFLDDYVTLP